jgi:hypothetical protein
MISTRLFPLVSLLFTAAIFGFFYAWVCSTMWGLDAADPAVATQAMQAMNASVRNAVFFPAFFLTPVVLALTSGLLFRAHQRGAAACFGLAAGVLPRGRVRRDGPVQCAHEPGACSGCRAGGNRHCPRHLAGLFGKLAVLEPDQDRGERPCSAACGRRAASAPLTPERH